MSRPQVQPLDPATPQGARVARELGELLARIALDIHQREQAPAVAAAVPVAGRSRRTRTSTTQSTGRQAA